MALVTGTEGNDSLVGSSDNDTIYGLAGDDQLYGSGRDDELTGGPGADLLDGGPGGRDSANYDTDTATQGVIVDLQAGTGHGGEAQGDRLVGIEVVEGSPFDDTVIGDAASNVLWGRGGDGHDVLHGGNGHDIIEGGDGNDFLRGNSDRYPQDDGPDTFLWRVFEAGAERDRIADFETGSNGDRLQFGIEFQEKSGIHDFANFLEHAEETDAGLYVDFSNGRHYDYGVLIENTDFADFTEDNIVFEDSIIG